MSDEDTTIHIKGLENIIKALKGKLPVCKVGIFGSKNARSGGKSNATIGAAHEYGTSSLPVRSFLRVPLSENLDKYLEKSGAFDKDVLEQVLKTASIKPWLEEAGVIAENVVQDAFATGGFGKWPAWKQGYSNNTGDILIDTTQLRNSISHEVE